MVGLGNLMLFRQHIGIPGDITKITHIVKLNCSCDIGLLKGSCRDPRRVEQVKCREKTDFHFINTRTFWGLLTLLAPKILFFMQTDILTINKSCKGCGGKMKIERCSEDGFTWKNLFCENWCFVKTTPKKNNTAKLWKNQKPNTTRLWNNKD